MLPSVFHTTLTYTPQSERDSEFPARFQLQTFPYHFLSLFQITSYINKLDGVSTDNIERSILEYSIVSFTNITDADGNIPKDSELVDILPLDIKSDLLNFIFEISMYTDKWMDTLEGSLHASLNPRFQDESWNCRMCQRRRMDRGRNCPFLPEEDHDPHVTYPVYGGSVSKCPVGTADQSLISQSFEAFRYRKQALLPEEGGIRNQTVFFMVASQKVEDIKNYYESQEQDKT